MDYFDLEILIEGEVVDTYGGNYTFMDVGYIIEDDGTYSFYERCYGAKPSDWEMVMDKCEYDYYMTLIDED